MINGARKVEEIPKNGDPNIKNNHGSTQREYTDYEEIK